MNTNLTKQYFTTIHIFFRWNVKIDNYFQVNGSSPLYICNSRNFLDYSFRLMTYISRRENYSSSGLRYIKRN